MDPPPACCSLRSVGVATAAGDTPTSGRARSRPGGDSSDSHPEFAVGPISTCVQYTGTGLLAAGKGTCAGAPGRGTVAPFSRAVTCHIGRNDDTGCFRVSWKSVRAVTDVWRPQLPQRNRPRAVCHGPACPQLGRRNPSGRHRQSGYSDGPLPWRGAAFAQALSAATSLYPASHGRPATRANRTARFRDRDSSAVAGRGPPCACAQVTAARSRNFRVRGRGSVRVDQTHGAAHLGRRAAAAGEL